MTIRTYDGLAIHSALLALMAETAAPNRIRWTMRKRVPASMLILAPESGTFTTIQAITGDELGAATRQRVLSAVAAGESERTALVATLAITERTLRRHVSALRKDGLLAPDEPLRLTAAVFAPVPLPVLPDLSTEQDEHRTGVRPDVPLGAGEGGHMSSPPPIGGGGMSAPVVPPDDRGAARAPALPRRICGRNVGQGRQGGRQVNAIAEARIVAEGPSTHHGTPSALRQAEVVACNAQPEAWTAESARFPAPRAN